MKYNNIKKGLNDIKEVKLSKDEKDILMNRLDLYIKENPLQNNTRQSMGWNGFFMQFKNYKYAYSAISMFLFVFVSVGFIDASENALPGDILYPVKLNLSEKIKSVLAFTPENKAKVEEERVIRRLEEAEALVKKGEFKEAKRIQLEKELEKSVKYIKKSKTKVVGMDIDIKSKATSTKLLIDDGDFTNKINSKLEAIKKIEENKDKDQLKNFEDKVKSQIFDDLDTNKNTDEKKLGL